MTITFPNPDPYIEAVRRGLVRRVKSAHRLRALAITAGLLTATGAATGAALTVQHVSQQAAQTGVVCYAHDDLTSLTGSAGLAAAVNPSTGKAEQPSKANKADMCALVWRAGLAQAAANGGHWPDIDPNTSTLPVPRLAYCRLSNGMTGGFPIEPPSTTASEVCDRLGLARDDLNG